MSQRVCGWLILEKFIWAVGTFEKKTKYTFQAFSLICSSSPISKDTDSGSINCKAGQNPWPDGNPSMHDVRSCNTDLPFASSHSSAARSPPPHQ